MSEAENTYDFENDPNYKGKAMVDLTPNDKAKWRQAYEECFFSVSGASPDPTFTDAWLELETEIINPDEAVDEDIYALSGD